MTTSLIDKSSERRLKGFIFIFGGEIVQRFVSTGAFGALESSCELIYVVLDRGDSEESDVYASGIKGKKIERIPFYNERLRRWAELFDISTIRYKDRSPSFTVRYQHYARLMPRRYRRLEKLARPGVYEKHHDDEENKMGLHPDLLNLVLREQPDFFVLPSCLQDEFTLEVLPFAKELQIPTLMLVSGWDNVSSKGLLYHHPTTLGVWGEQSEKHAVEVQGVNPDSVYSVGAPHYELFRERKDVDRVSVLNAWGIPSDNRVILFAGTLRQFDETQLLREIEAAIDSELLPAMHLIYRPHPWRTIRMSEDNFFNYSWQHVTMDPQMAAVYQASKDGKVASHDTFLFDLEHLNDLYRVVDAAISPMSTVLLEAILFGLPTMAVAFGDEKHDWSADKVSRMLHFEEWFKLPGVVVCRERSNVLSSIQRLVSRIGDVTLRNRLRQDSCYFAHCDNRSYADRLVSLVEITLSKAGSVPGYDTIRVRPGRRFLLQSYVRPRWQVSVVRRVLREIILRIHRFAPL